MENRPVIMEAYIIAREVTFAHPANGQRMANRERYDEFAGTTGL